jgi:hypothetical protein
MSHAFGYAGRRLSASLDSAGRARVSHASGRPRSAVRLRGSTCADASDASLAAAGDLDKGHRDIASAVSAAQPCRAHLPQHGMTRVLVGNEYGVFARRPAVRPRADLDNIRVAYYVLRVPAEKSPMAGPDVLGAT